MEPSSTGRRRHARRKAGLLVGFLTVTAAAAAKAEGTDARWSAEPRVSLAAAANSVWQPGSGAYYGSLTGSAAVNFSAPLRPRKAGVFVLYRLTSGAAEPDSLQAAGWASADFSRWRASGAAMYLDPRRGAGHWYYTGNLRFRVSGEHWLGFEAAGRGGNGRPCTRLAYEGQVAGFLWLRVSVGLGADGRTEAAARSEFVWRIR
jgi:hypothetical protein